MASKLDVALLQFEDLTTSDLLAWQELEASAAAVNPFLTPTWCEAWFDVYVPARHRYVVLVRQEAGGQLLGVAPVYVEEARVGPLRVARRVLPVGQPPGNPFEIPGHLSRAGHHRDVTREVVAACLSMEADWSTISLATDQGWFEPEHLLGQEPRGTLWQQLRSRACVVLPLAPTWDQTRSGLKRNIKESLRRSRNRMKNSATSFDVRRRTGDDLDAAAVGRLFDLHRDRSGNEQASQSHPDVYADERNRRVMELALPRLAAQGRASVVELVADGAVAASQLVLHAPGASYLHSSGFRPEFWDLSPLTHLVGVVAQDACERGDSILNFSPGPRVSKLRWSETLWVATEFAFGSGPRSLLTRYSALRAAAALRPDSAGISWIPGREAQSGAPELSGERAGGGS